VIFNLDIHLFCMFFLMCSASLTRPVDLHHSRVDKDRRYEP